MEDCVGLGEGVDGIGVFVRGGVLMRLLRVSRSSWEVFENFRESSRGFNKVSG
jgi:hypothetical protein